MTWVLRSTLQTFLSTLKSMFYVILKTPLKTFKRVDLNTSSGVVGERKFGANSQEIPFILAHQHRGPYCSFCCWNKRSLRICNKQNTVVSFREHMKQTTVQQTTLFLNQFFIKSFNRSRCTFITIFHQIRF